MRITRGLAHHYDTRSGSANSDLVISGDRHRAIARTRRNGGTGLNPEDWLWMAADCTAGEERIKALSRGRLAGLPPGAFTAEDGRRWH